MTKFMAANSRIKKGSLEEKTTFELFDADERKEPFLELEYPRLIYLEEGDHVNIIAEKGSNEASILRPDGIFLGDRYPADFSPMEYIVKNSGNKGRVNMSLHIGGKKNFVYKFYTLVRVKRKH